MKLWNTIAALFAMGCEAEGYVVAILYGGYEHNL